MIQSVKKEIGADLSFGEICERASKTTIPSLVDANDDRFLMPENMTEEVKKACKDSGQQVPEGIAEVAAMGGANKLDPTQLRVGDIYETSICPLARIIRKECRKRGIDHLVKGPLTRECIQNRFIP